METKREAINSAKSALEQRLWEVLASADQRDPDEVAGLIIRLRQALSEIEGLSNDISPLETQARLPGAHPSVQERLKLP